MSDFAARTAWSRPPEGPTARMRRAIVAVAVAAILILHYTLSRDALLYHDLLRRGMYVPIILAAVWFGMRGGVAVALVAAFLSTPHLFLQHWHIPTPNLDWAAEMLLYVVVGGLTGVLVEREKSQRRRAEEAVRQLERANADLREQSERLAEVQETLRQTERLSTLGEVAADLAHEIRNPLATMRGTVQILAGNPPEQDRKEFTRMLLSEIDRLDGVVEGYLRAARVPVADHGPTDAVVVLGSVAALTRGQAEQSGVTLERTGASHLPVPMGLGALTQVFMNLTLNAFQAMPAGGALRIDGRVIEGRAEQGTQAEIVFADSGPGVSAENRDKVFRPFFTTRQAGTGLGLGIARRIVEEHGGTLTLDEPGERGAVFRLRLPLAGA